MVPTFTVQVPEVMTAFSLTFPPLTSTVNSIPDVDPTMSVVDTSVYPAVELFQTALTVPDLIAPPLSVTQ